MADSDSVRRFMPFHFLDTANIGYLCFFFNFKNDAFDLMFYCSTGYCFYVFQEPLLKK